MASNLDYLAAELKPLEEKLQAYLAAEKELEQAEIAATNLTQSPPPDPDVELGQRPAPGSFPQPVDEAANELQNLRDDLIAQRQEIIGLLPAHDEWIKINLGYGPSRVGAFSVPAPGTGYELRVVI
ncbi:hypothetical protein [Hymenobacter psychrophilus]|uniref:Uncharacterized protein n=1 Tax=Hymenobacter psychrophilus TaxID=651662 RepID=A0A1H3NKQ3_9BACT|nr:hypothetical protein [Hymenobacter psychrophilus]SDY89462.1 hypothetical protein SAMN04488069_11755 [Hymenobacter psychrophilus]